VLLSVFHVSVLLYHFVAGFVCVTQCHLSVCWCLLHALHLPDDGSSYFWFVGAYNDVGDGSVIIIIISAVIFAPSSPLSHCMLFVPVVVDGICCQQQCNCWPCLLFVGCCHVVDILVY